MPGHDCHGTSPECAMVDLIVFSLDDIPIFFPCHFLTCFGRGLLQLSRNGEIAKEIKSSRRIHISEGGRIDGTSHTTRQMMFVPMIGNLLSRADPDISAITLGKVDELLQRGDAGGPGKAAVNSHRHHLGLSRSTFGYQKTGSHSKKKEEVPVKNVRYLSDDTNSPTAIPSSNLPQRLLQVPAKVTGLGPSIIRCESHVILCQGIGNN